MTEQEIKEAWDGWRASGMTQEVQCVFGRSACDGVQLVEAIHPAFRVPIGMAYFLECDPWEISLGYINVVEQLRRRGIGRRIVHAIAIRYPSRRLYTETATELAKPFLEKLGWLPPGEKRNRWVSV